MSRVTHFEIHADDPARARDLSGPVFGWVFEDWSEFAGMAYFGATTGDDDQPGINGAIMPRAAAGGGPGAPVNGAVLTMGTDDDDATAAKIFAADGQLALAKQALPGMAWQGYYLDTEGNVFGVHQPDPEAR